MKHCLVAVLFLFCILESPGEPSFKVRALWIDPSGFSSAASTDEMIAKCQRAGINTILANVMSHGVVSFKSTQFRGRVNATDAFDPTAYMIEKAHAAGIQFHAWVCVYYQGAKRPEQRLWPTLSFDGKPSAQDFLSAAHPEVNPYLLSVISELFAYKLDGIHLDYIRYPGSIYDYSEPARRAFQAQSGFDPIHFLDHPEKIVPAKQDPFPVRVLCADSHREWETVATERTLDGAGIGFAFVSEKAENIDALRVPGLLILSQYHDVTPAMVGALQRYAERGGNILWCDAPTRSLGTNAEIRALTGLSGGKWRPDGLIKLLPVGNHLLTKFLPAQAIRTPANSAASLNGATLIATLDNDVPAVTMREVGKGRVVVLGFNVMGDTVGSPLSLLQSIRQWLQPETGDSNVDPLAAKRAEWIAWRGEQVTRLVREVSRAAKATNPSLIVSSSGGPSPWEFYSCYRNARQWLAEGINDCVFPMNYTEDPATFREMLQNQARHIPPEKFDRVYPGLQTYAVRQVEGKRVSAPIAASVVREQLLAVQEQGHQGFCLFAYNTFSDEIIEVVRQFANAPFDPERSPNPNPNPPR